MPIPPEHDQIREFFYIHMWVSFWQTFYVMGMMPEDQLRRACERELFYGEPGRRYWGYSKDTRPLYTKDHREQDFIESWKKSITRPSPVIRRVHQQ